MLSRRQLLSASLGVPLLVASKSATGAATARASFIQHGVRTSKEFALTFHGAGPSALAQDMVAIATHLDVKLTVFAVGSWVASNESLVRDMKRAGHELANHTLTHPALRKVNRAGVATEINGCAQALRVATGSIGAWFRPSGTPTPTTLILEEAVKAGYPTVVGYDVDPRDYQDPGSKLVISRTRAGLQPGSIVSLHLGHRGTVDALESIVVAARKDGLEPVTVSALLQN